MTNGQKILGSVLMIIFIILAILFLYDNESKRMGSMDSSNNQLEIYEGPIDEENEEETMNWNTYIYNNNGRGYSLKYPNKWIIINGSGSHDLQNSPSIGIENESIENIHSIGFGVGLYSPTIVITDLSYYYAKSTAGMHPDHSYASIDNF